jgi:hypothetical protein
VICGAFGRGDEKCNATIGFKAAVELSEDWFDYPS